MRKTLAATSLVVLLALVGTTAAIAGSQSRYRTDGFTVSTYWTQVDGPPARNPATQPFGNVHLGWLDAYETSRGRADAWAYIDDFRCPVGVLPDDGGHGGDEPGCEYLGSRFGEGYGLTLAVDRKLATARLTGQLTITHGGDHGGGGGVVGRPTADITWTAKGATYRSTSTFRGEDGTSRYSDRYTSRSRNATMGGTLGPMGFDPALSGGSISSFRSMYREQSR